MTYAFTRRPRTVGAAFAALLVAASLALAGCGSETTTSSHSGTLNGSEVEFSLANLDKGARFFTYQTENGKVGLLAVKDSTNTARVALDTCQVCNGSPKAYFLEKDGVLQCQNCGNTFSYDIVGDTSQGCEPMPMDSTSWYVDGDTLSVDEAALENVAPLFSTWAKQ